MDYFSQTVASAIFGIPLLPRSGEREGEKNFGSVFANVSVFICEVVYVSKGVYVYMYAYVCMRKCVVVWMK